MIPQAQKSVGEGLPGYETSDLPPRPVVLVGLTVALMLLVFGVTLSRWLSHHSTVSGPLRTVPLASVNPQNPLGEPTDTPPLQLDEVADEARMRQQLQTRLHSYGRAADGSIHIPIEAAISLILARGLPAADSTPESEKKSNQ